MKQAAQQPYERCSCNDHCDGTPKTCEALQHQCKDGRTDERLLLSAHALLIACEAVLTAKSEYEEGCALSRLRERVQEIRGEAGKR